MINTRVSVLASLLVLITPCLLGETLLTVFALVGSFASMDALVGNHVGTLDKALATKAARVLLHFKVDLLVAILASYGGEFLSTDRARDTVVSLVGFEMAGQISFS